MQIFLKCVSKRFAIFVILILVTILIYLRNFLKILKSKIKNQVKNDTKIEENSYSSNIIQECKLYVSKDKGVMNILLMLKREK